MLITTSLPAARSAGVGSTFNPVARALSGVRLQTIISCPSPASRDAMPAPILPMPAMPTFMSLVSIPTDTVALEGAWYEPDAAARSGAALLFHGNTMNFYSGAPRFLPPALTELGLACLAFNRRGHDILAIRDSRAAEGAAFQTIAEAVADNRFAAAWLAQRGFPHPVVIGHSNGGMLAVRHVADHPETPALVLLSAHCGGKNMVPLASKSGLLAGDRLAELTAQAERMVADGRGRELMLLPGWWYVTSAASFLDLANCPDMVELALQCDHFYRGREAAVSAIVSRWLMQTLKTGRQK